MSRQSSAEPYDKGCCGGCTEEDVAAFVLATGGPLWRLHLVHDPGAGAAHLHFTRSHAISDGRSTGAVVRALLDTLFAPTDRASPYHVRSVAPNGDELTYRPPERPGIP